MYIYQNKGIYIIKDISELGRNRQICSGEYVFFWIVIRLITDFPFERVGKRRWKLLFLYCYKYGTWLCLNKLLFAIGKRFMHRIVSLQMFIICWLLFYTWKNVFIFARIFWESTSSSLDWSSFIINKGYDIVEIYV